MVETLEKLPESKKTDGLVRIYFALAKFVAVGFVIFLLVLLLFKLFPILNSENFLPDFVALIIITLGTIWAIILALLLPLGIMLYGIWGIVNKESAIRTPYPIHPVYPVIHLSGTSAVVAGWFFLILGLFFLWGIAGVIISFACGQNTICTDLPNFIKFF
jgi:hypothetical protein